MKEIWKAIPTWEDKYEISNKGRVRSLSCKITYYRPDLKVVHQRIFPGRILSAGITQKGYFLVVFSRRSKTKPQYVHQLVAKAFVGPRPEGLEIRHLNGNPRDNRPINLKYGTTKENAQDTIKHRKQKHRRQNEQHNNPR